MDCLERQSATIVPFDLAGRRASALSMTDRMQVMAWTDGARDHGVRAVRIHEPEPGDDPAVGPFLLIYRIDDTWAAWGVARRLRGYELWRASTGSTVGMFESIGAALGAIATVS